MKHYNRYLIFICMLFNKNKNITEKSISYPLCSESWILSSLVPFCIEKGLLIEDFLHNNHKPNCPIHSLEKKRELFKSTYEAYKIGISESREKLTGEIVTTLIDQPKKYSFDEAILVHGTINLKFNDFYSGFFKDKKIKKGHLRLHKEPQLVAVDKQLSELSWPGNLDDSQRRAAAWFLYLEMKKQVKPFIIGHSHGGTIVLLTLSYLLDDPDCKNLLKKIKGIILVGTPIDNENNDIAIKIAQTGITIYNIFSYGDFTQIADPTMKGCQKGSLTKRHICSPISNLPIFNIHLALQIDKNKILVPGHIEFPGFFATKSGKMRHMRLAWKYSRSKPLYEKDGINDLLHIAQSIKALHDLKESKETNSIEPCYILYVYQ